MDPAADSFVIGRSFMVWRDIKSPHGVEKVFTMNTSLESPKADRPLWSVDQQGAVRPDPACDEELHADPRALSSLPFALAYRAEDDPKDEEEDLEDEDEEDDDDYDEEDDEDWDDEDEEDEHDEDEEDWDDEDEEDDEEDEAE